MTSRKCPAAADYAPYDKFTAFQEGYDAYDRNCYENPYDRKGRGVDAQAWDRGLEFASRCKRFLAGY